MPAAPDLAGTKVDPRIYRPWHDFRYLPVVISTESTYTDVETLVSGRRCAVREHVAIVRPSVAKALLLRVKQVEARLYRRRRSPFGLISSGDRVHFKISGGDIIGTATVTAVRHVFDLTPQRVRILQTLFGNVVHAPEHFWRRRLSARYAVLVWVSRLRRCRADLRVPRQYGDAWIVLDGWGCGEASIDPTTRSKGG
jgi:hypothetical protein